MSFFAHAVQWRRQMYAAPLGLLLFLARSLLLKEKQWVESFTEREFLFLCTFIGQNTVTQVFLNIQI